MMKYSHATTLDHDDDLYNNAITTTITTVTTTNTNALPTTPSPASGIKSEQRESSAKEKEEEEEEEEKRFPALHHQQQQQPQQQQQQQHQLQHQPQQIHQFRFVEEEEEEEEEKLFAVHRHHHHLRQQQHHYQQLQLFRFVEEEEDNTTYNDNNTCCCCCGCRWFTQRYTLLVWCDFSGFATRNNNYNINNQQHHCSNRSDRDSFSDKNATTTTSCTTNNLINCTSNINNNSSTANTNINTSSNDCRCATVATSTTTITATTRTNKILMAVTSVSVFLLLGVFLTAAIAPGSLFLFNDPDGSGNNGPVPTERVTTLSSSPPPSIRVAAFNIRTFGRTLVSKDHVVSSLVKIFHRYDIVLVQEVRDSSLTAVRDFLTSLKLSGGEDWAFVASQPLGRSDHYKEQYVYFYKTARVKIISSYQVADDARDVYEREPFAVEIEYFPSSSAVVASTNNRVVLLGLHAKPTDVESELGEFSKTVVATASRFKDSQGVIAMGDLNADCSYLNEEGRGQLDLFSSSSFVSLIGDDADTTVSKNTDCAYDRVLVYRNCPVGTGSSSCLHVSGASVFNFETSLNLGYDEAREVSDHYPVEFLLY